MTWIPRLGIVRFSALTTSVSPLHVCSFRASDAIGRAGTIGMIVLHGDVTLMGPPLITRPAMTEDPVVAHGGQSPAVVAVALRIVAWSDRIGMPRAPMMSRSRFSMYPFAVQSPTSPQIVAARLMMPGTVGLITQVGDGPGAPGNVSVPMAGTVICSPYAFVTHGPAGSGQ
jgi:hypothetical protein